MSFFVRVATAAAALATSGCSRSMDAQSDPADVAVVALPELDRPPEPRKNMVWIPPGPFVAGTPADVLPRAPDEEMPGVQVVLHGYYIDQYPFPNEPGAIETTGLSRNDAKEKCETQGKRLCSELEWERACKGPKSTVYEYGDSYRRDDCGVAAVVALVPAGARPACRSAFDVFDLHGGAFEWTSSAWERGTSERDVVAVRGGSGEPGEVFGRCANAAPKRSSAKLSSVGFRCCAGDRNDAAVSIDVVRAPEPFKPLARTPELVAAIGRTLPRELSAMLPPGEGGAWTIDRAWSWDPVGNESLVVSSGCAHPTVHALCGIVVARRAGAALIPMSFASSGWWIPSAQLDQDPRILWVYGGDALGKYRERVAYTWGRISISQPVRGALTTSKRKKRKP